MEELSLQRAADMFIETIENDVKKSRKTRHAEMYSNDPIGKSMNPRYALLPAWFLTTRTDDVPRTILVNGQTGKMVGAVPFVKWKAYAMFALLTVLFTTPLILFSMYVLPALFGAAGEEKLRLTMYTVSGFGVLVALIWRNAWRKIDAMIKSRSLTESAVTKKFVSERQER
ncbi:MAG: hypothetical protein ILO68_03105 [Clostridia bacterium]|nr:hypothetical protein [Clostridia bacterium]